MTGGYGSVVVSGENMELLGVGKNGKRVCSAVKVSVVMPWLLETLIT